MIRTLAFGPCRPAAPVAALVAALFLLGAAPAAAQTWIEGDIAVLQALDKITARISTFEAPVGEVSSFDQLSVLPRACRKRPPEETPESAAFLEVDELRADEVEVRVFTGWMFASSPALSALEHPVYDLRLVDCKKAEKSESSSSE
ncbi:MAG: DUF2155 domain-containing protein [Rhodospirillaceae bacterium]|jgi:hypothetical protein|nr:DUF2155 domain-containing protein [Rhodospirillaceae bacterium]MBT6118464.1 DUF2155 domain-containing protein [Rhodospirillaceae bacterium]